MVQLSGAVVWLALVAGLALGGPGGQGQDQCASQCQQVYSLNTGQYEQVRPSLDSCLAGCQFFSRIEARNGFEDALGNLQNCNYSCDERFEGGLLPACQSGCGFHFDSDMAARRTSQGPPAPTPTFSSRGPPPPAPSFSSRGPPPPAPTFPRARGPAFARSQGPPRPTVFRTEEPQWVQETPRTSQQSEVVMPPRVPVMRSDNPFLEMLRSQGPVMLRPQSFNMTPQRVSPPEPQPNMVTRQNPRGPTIIGFSLPQLLQRILPRVEQALPNMQEMPSMEQIFQRMEQQQEDHEEEEEHQPSVEFELPSMDQMFSRLEQALPDIENSIEPLMNRVMEIEIENPFEEFEEFSEGPEMKETPRMSLPWAPRGIFGHKDQDEFGFSGLFDQMSSQFSQSWSPFGQPHQAGKLTIIKAGPGFHDEQHFDIGPDGNLIEITETPIGKDALQHKNPMDVHFNSNNVEVFHNDAVTDIEPQAEIIEVTEAEPVMDVWAVEEGDSQAQPQVESFEFSAKQLPFLSVLRNSVEENERMSQQLLERYRSLAEREYRDDFTCNSDHLKWSDWVACLHARVGVPRWLTAATISLGIVFSVWLCLVIPSAAPKQRIRALVIKTEKPSAALAKAKEAEACSKACEAAGVDPSTVVSVVRVDLPPSYGDVRPASPAPSYKSEMGVPASPAPSYRSVAPGKEDAAGDCPAVLEPVHKETKESLA